MRSNGSLERKKAYILGLTAHYQMIFQYAQNIDWPLISSNICYKLWSHNCTFNENGENPLFTGFGGISAINGRGPAEDRASERLNYVNGVGVFLRALIAHTMCTGGFNTEVM